MNTDERRAVKKFEELYAVNLPENWVLLKKDWWLKRKDHYKTVDDTVKELDEYLRANGGRSK